MINSLVRVGLGILVVVGIAGGAKADYVTLNYDGSIPNSSTYLTGIRADNSGGVYMTGVYTPGGSSGTQGLIYRGPVMGGGTWWILNQPGATTTSTALYGPNTLSNGNIRVAGSYKTSETGARDLGLFYEGPAAGGGTWTTLTPTHSGETTLNTIAHSTHGDLLVGNFDTDLATGRAFIYDIVSQSYRELTKAGVASITAYGVWYNGGTSYTIAGGYSAIGNEGLSVGYLLDYDIVTGVTTNWTDFYYDNAPGEDVITHFDGITGDGNGGYNLTGDWIADGTSGAFYAQVSRDGEGGFGEADWLDIAYPSEEGLDVDATSGNSVYEDYVIGVYTANGEGLPNGYVVHVPEPAVWAQLAGGAVLLLLLARRCRGARAGSRVA
ncbi:hypothetical protein H5P28_18755 [Ruficoccus amylovorans]|uniref:Uncharacterized protein n=1 Tax=Ruficoccus amylovorans TaxID=1804625 RepID=A0A842HIS3_9BACT|nr:hypothetical protein [Ruficoccus amylovorans]MBC2596312.1 hypothetical protein [Ruficoccus amylovorans]